MEIFKELTEEYLISLTNITCEVTVSEVSNELAFLLLDLNKKLENLNAEWVIKPCSTCLEYYPNKPLHIEIIKKVML